MKHKYFTEKERYQLEILLKKRVPISTIAKDLDKSRTTIYNEIKRGTVVLKDTFLNTYSVYKADVAQRVSDYNQTAKGRQLKIGNDYNFVKVFTSLILDKKLSPYCALEVLKRDYPEIKTRISLSTAYNYIHNNLFLNVSSGQLPCPRKKKKSNTNCIRSVCLHNLNARSISDRPSSVDSRSDLFHWELDTVVSGKSGSGALLVLTERKTRFEIIKKLNSKSASDIKIALDNLELEIGSDKFRYIFQSLTCDNGSEFLDSDSITKSVNGGRRTILYYCHPYSSWERGSNENQNRLIRRWIPKGSDISRFSESFILYVEDWLNTIPRKLFNSYSSSDLFNYI